MKRCYVRRRREGRQGPVMPLRVVAIVSVTTMLLHADLEFACLLKSAFRAAIEERLRDSFHSVH